MMRKSPFWSRCRIGWGHEAPSIWCLLRMCTQLYSIYNRSTYKINKTSQGDLSCRSIKVCHWKPACPSVITDVKTAGKPKNWSYNLPVTAFTKEAVFFFHRSAPQLGFIISFSFLLHPRVVWVLCFCTLEFKRLIPLKAFLPHNRLIKHLTFARIVLFNKYRLLGPGPK